MLATGLVQVPWILGMIARGTKGIRATTRWSEFANRDCQVLAWEAFITSRDGMRPDLKRYQTKRSTAHEHDALSGAATFLERLIGGNEIKSELEPEPSISLIAWHLLSCGLSSDRSLIAEPCIVVKARKRASNKKRTSQ